MICTCTLNEDTRCIDIDSEEDGATACATPSTTGPTVDGATFSPTAIPTAHPTAIPTAHPTANPTANATANSTAKPTANPADTIPMIPTDGPELSTESTNSTPTDGPELSVSTDKSGGSSAVVVAIIVVMVLGCLAGAGFVKYRRWSNTERYQSHKQLDPAARTAMVLNPAYVQHAAAAGHSALADRGTAAVPGLVAYDVAITDPSLKAPGVSGGGTLEPAVRLGRVPNAYRVLSPSYGIQRPAKTGTYAELAPRQVAYDGHMTQGGNVRLTLKGSGGPDYLVPTAERRSGVVPVAVLAEGTSLYAVPMAPDGDADNAVVTPTSLCGDADA